MKSTDLKPTERGPALSAGAKKIFEQIQSCGISPQLDFHIVLGSGFKDALQTGIPKNFEIKGEINFSEVPGLHAATVPGHSGKYVFIENAQTKKSGLIQVGRLHGYEGLDPREVVRTVMIGRELGIEKFFVTNAAGGFGPDYHSGEVMLFSDHINLTGKTPLYGENPKKPDGSEWGPRFPDLTRLYDREMSEALKSALHKENLKVHEGVYVGTSGPAYETPAEIRFFQKIGGHAVGMSTVWETIALKHSGARVCALSLISNLGAGLQVDSKGKLQSLDHRDVLAACQSASISILRALLLIT